MPKVNYVHLEQVRKALTQSAKFLESLPATCENFEKEKREKTISNNKKAIEMLDEEYLDIKQ